MRLGKVMMETTMDTPVAEISDFFSDVIDSLATEIVQATDDTHILEALRPSLVDKTQTDYLLRARGAFHGFLTMFAKIGTQDAVSATAYIPTNLTKAEAHAVAENSVTLETIRQIALDAENEVLGAAVLADGTVDAITSPIAYDSAKHSLITTSIERGAGCPLARNGNPAITSFFLATARFAIDHGITNTEPPRHIWQA